jgi:hypothetical protein
MVLTYPGGQNICRSLSATKMVKMGSRNLMGPKTLPTIWGTYMMLVTKYQISVINSCWEKCDEKCAYMFNVYKDQLSRETGSRNLTLLVDKLCHYNPFKLWLHIWMNCLCVYHIVGSVFGPVRFLLPVCRLNWSLYTLNIYAHFSSHFSQQIHK